MCSPKEPAVHTKDYCNFLMSSCLPHSQTWGVYVTSENVMLHICFSLVPSSMLHEGKPSLPFIIVCSPAVHAKYSQVWGNKPEHELGSPTQSILMLTRTSLFCCQGRKLSIGFFNYAFNRIFQLCFPLQ